MFPPHEQDLMDHQVEVHQKLISIMNDRLAAHCKSLQVISVIKPSIELVGVVMEPVCAESAISFLDHNSLSTGISRSRMPRSRTHIWMSS